jgi:sugar phosphate isomerase/epimerase
MKAFDRRVLLKSAAGLAMGGGIHALANSALAADGTAKRSTPKMRFGLVTYMWGADWELPTLLKNCETAHADGVELRTGHAHGVEPEISAQKRTEVKQRFADSPITLIGMGTNQDFHHPDSKVLRASIDRAKKFIKLSHDIGGTGVKVKPNDLPKEVPHEKTIEQIGKSLNDLGAFGAELGQQVRLEVHGQCSPLPTIAAIMRVADHPNVRVCWNSNAEDLHGEGLEHNFHLVEKRLGATLHAKPLDTKKYPFPKLFNLLQAIHYTGWVLIEANTQPSDRVAALAHQRQVFDKLVGTAL